MKVSELDPEQWAAHQERIRQTLVRVDAVNAGLAERAEQRQRDGTDIEERYEERLRQREERDRAATQQFKPAPVTRAPARDWQAEQAWISRIIDRKISAYDKGFGPLAEAIGATIGKLERRVRELEDRVTASETATVQLITELEAQIKALREHAVTRPQRPRLVGADDDAA
jgi:hypothetical protein